MAIGLLHPPPPGSVVVVVVGPGGVTGRLVVPLMVPPRGGMTVGLLQSPASAGARALPWQAATPSCLQRPSTLLRQARGWPPAPTHAAISSPHALRHCRATEAASAASARYSAASSVSSDVNPRVFGRGRMVQPPRASPSRVPGQSVAGGHVQPSNHPRALCGARGARADVDVALPFG